MFKPRFNWIALFLAAASWFMIGLTVNWFSGPPAPPVPPNLVEVKNVDDYQRPSGGGGMIGERTDTQERMYIEGYWGGKNQVFTLDFNKVDVRYR